MADEKQSENEELRRQDRLAARKSRARFVLFRQFVTLTVIVLAFALGYQAMRQHYEIERTRAIAEAAKQEAELALRKQELEQARLATANDALVKLTAILQGPGPAEEKKRSFQIALGFYISIGALPKAAEKLIDWADLGAKGLGVLFDALRKTSSDDIKAAACCAPSNAACCPMVCSKPAPPRTAKLKPAPQKCS